MTTNDQKLSRHGFHYFPDTLHYRDIDIQTWLPTMKSLGASWVVLKSSSGRAIPENFLRTLVSENIEPIITFSLSLDMPLQENELSTLFQMYSKWGVRYISLYDRPNDRKSWRSANWVQQDLVNRFIDQYLPLVNQLSDFGINSVFPALEPGGSYWDTIFLRSSLELLEKNGIEDHFNNMVISAYGWKNEHPLTWGEGGSEKWPDAKPYFTPEDTEDHRGFRIFEWYNEVVNCVIGTSLPIIIYHAGLNSDPKSVTNHSKMTLVEDTPQKFTNIVKLLSGEKVININNPEDQLSYIPDYVISSNFWLLSADPASPAYQYAWIKETGNDIPDVERIKEYWLEKNQKIEQKAEILSKQIGDTTPFDEKSTQETKEIEGRIQHYLLLPKYDWGVSDWHIEVIKPFIMKYFPTVGFSIDEARNAEKVTMIGGIHTFSEKDEELLIQSGCTVDRIDGDGIAIATKLAER